MTTLELKLTRIGNSRGVRLPVGLLKRYGFGDMLKAEMREEGVLLKAKGGIKLSWAETAREMAASGEDWSEWDMTIADGLENAPWDGPVPSAVRNWAKQSARRERGVGKKLARNVTP